MEIVLTILLIIGVLVSMIIGLPMRRQLIKETDIKRILLFQMPFFLKDYNKMIEDTEDASKKARFRLYFTVYLVSNLIFIVAGILLLFSGETISL